MSESLLVFMVPTDRRDDVVDLLMGTAALSGFTLLPALGYSRDHSRFSLTEQVVGYRDLDRFEVLVDADGLNPLLELLSGHCGSERLRFWVLDVAATGHLPLD